MKFFVEESQYPLEVVANNLMDAMYIKENDVATPKCVGYYFNKDIRDCVFVLPKVILDREGQAFGQYKKEELINLKIEKLTQQDRSSLFELMTLLYRSLCVYQGEKTNSEILLRPTSGIVGSGGKKSSITLLDTILALQDFYKKNRNFFLFVIKNQHSGLNKINWTRTMAKSKAFIDSEMPVYLNPINKKKCINFDEELLIIFYSILNFVHHHFGFPAPIDFGYELIKGKKFERYLDGYGKRRLQQIKYKYFSDKTQHLWKLCVAFFDQYKELNRKSSGKQEYLLAKDFDVVFESMIDKLINDPNLANLKDQSDGKRIDHLYKDLSVLPIETAGSTYYIGDSKYYKPETGLGEISIYKQFTYARNIVQWHIDNTGEDGVDANGVALRDTIITEGYNIVPNFFISTQLYDGTNKHLSHSSKVERVMRDNQPYRSCQFKNRLFDRDTQLVTHYNVYLLSILSLYASKNTHLQKRWQKEVRQQFRTEYKNELMSLYDFYRLTPKDGVDAKVAIEENFKLLIGKIYSPSPGEYLLVLEKEFKIENNNVLRRVSECFIIVDVQTGQRAKFTHPVQGNAI